MAKPVELIDPMDSVSNLPNGTPQYEDLFIFAELLGERRERSVLTLNTTQGSNVSLQTELSNANVNMLGVDFKKDVNDKYIKNSTSFTTKWTDNVTNTTSTLEGFGITNIDVKISSSFIPKVKIEFVDIRGMTFFNLGDNSPYSILFDFPPPIFKMTLKGYYGKSLDYDLHLKKHSTRFDSKTGNYYITVDFVGRTFAPLADIPFKFVELVSLMATKTEPETDPKTQQSAIQDPNNSTNQEELNSDPRVPPRNTFELVEKIKKLTDELKDLKNTSKEGKAFNDALQSLTKGDEVIQYMNSFSSKVNNIFSNVAFVVSKNKGNNPDNNTKDDGGLFEVLDSVTRYDGIIREGNDSGNNSIKQDTKLYLAILSHKVVEGNFTATTNGTKAESITSINIYRKSLIQKGKSFSDRNINVSDIGEPEVIYDYNPKNKIGDGDYDQYTAIDVTKFYNEINKVLKTKRDVVNESQADLVTIVNERITKTLGFEPTLYNIFKVLCDDIDTFFKVLGSVSLAAEDHHKKYFDRIIDQIQEEKSENVTKTIYPFPLYIKSETTDCVNRKVRRIPKDIKPDEVEFPEVSFTKNFIDTMITLKKERSVDDLKIELDGIDNNIWIPVTPADSILHGGSGYDSPYASLEFTSGGANSVDEVYKRLINRYYIASQFTFGESFYSTDRNSGFIWWGDKSMKRNDLIRYVAKAEAVNVANSVTNPDVINSLLNSAEKSSGNDESSFGGNPQNFYNHAIKKNYSIYNEIPNNVLKLTQDITPLYRNRKNPDFVGMEIPNELSSIRIDGQTGSGSPVDQYLNEDIDFWNSVTNFFSIENENPIQNFTTENIPYFPDYTDEDDNIYKTKYLNGLRLNRLFGLDSLTFDTINYLKDATIWNPEQSSSNFDPAGQLSNADYAVTLSTILSIYNKEIKEFLTGTTGNTYSLETQAFVLASMFGRARSYFSLLGQYAASIINNIGNVNSRFLNPAVVEVPRFSSYYMGALLEYNKGGVVFNEIQELLNEDNDWFKVVSIDGGYIFDDSSRIENLGVNDADIFLEEYSRWSSSDNEGFVGFKNEILSLIDNIDPNEDDIEDTLEAMIKKIKEDNTYGSINQDMIAKSAILNYSEYTFNNNVNTEVIYEPLVDTNASLSGDTESKRSANDLFFNTFFEKLSKELKPQKKKLDEVESDFESIVNDEDIETQLYYSFKTISDKWVSGIDTSKKGFPLNNSIDDPLISKFAFVDRAMNPIGKQVVINAEALIELSEDYDINMFQVFSRLLSLNGFEFFPLQNFMVFNNKEGNWKDAFKPFTTLEQQPTPAFVCMYLGGTSSTLNNTASRFDDDGILDLDETGLPDFNVKDCDDIVDDENNEVNDKKIREKTQGEAEFTYSEPKAFRVRFGEQNQSFFTDIQLDGREFTATVDSLAILSRIAGDGGTTPPIPKGQNMFSTYENRAYSVSVTMLGNVMVQPTQYFQLENIPMYSGAYMITDVSHKVTANHMTTTFEGTRILKYPNPFVKNFATLVGIESGTSEDLSATQSLIDGGAISAKTLPYKESGIYYNEQFSLKISP